MYPSLRTRRLTLRPLEITDAPRLREIFVNSDVMENLNANTPWPYPDDESEKFVRKSLENWGASGEMVWAILLNHEEPPIGLITLRPKAIRDHRGFWLGRDYWGRA